MTPLRILIIDDSPEDRELYRRLFARIATADTDYELIEASTLDEGLARLDEEPPDCVMLDYHLPDGDGLELLSRASASLGHGAVQVVMLTGAGNEAVAVEAMKLGAADYLTKSRITAEVLRRTVAAAVERRSLHLKLQHLEEEHRQFVHTAAHDMKAPLRQVGQYAELVLRRAGDRLGADERRFVERMVDISGRARKLVDDLLEYSTTHADDADFELVDLDDVASEVVASVSCLACEAGAVIDVGTLGPIRGRRHLLVRLLQNLLTNAIKFRRGDAVRVEVRTEARDDELVLAVRDDGIGIPADKVDAIFAPFRRLHAKADYEGSGVGLATCQRVAETHGGRIWAESREGEGSTFFVAFPRPAADGPRPRLLVVDDDPIDADLAIACLSSRFDVETAASADEALARLGRERFDVVVSDHDMPERDGMWLLGRVAEEHPGVVRILTSNRTFDPRQVSVGHFLPKTASADTVATLLPR